MHLYFNVSMYTCMDDLPVVVRVALQNACNSGRTLLKGPGECKRHSDTAGLETYPLSAWTKDIASVWWALI